MKVCLKSLANSLVVLRIVIEMNMIALGLGELVDQFTFVFIIEFVTVY